MEKTTTTFRFLLTLLSVQRPPPATTFVAAQSVPTVPHESSDIPEAGVALKASLSPILTVVGQVAYDPLELTRQVTVPDPPTERLTL